MNLKNRKALTALLLALALLAACFGAPAEGTAAANPILKEGETEGSGSIQGTWKPDANTRFSNESAVKAYIHDAMHFQAGKRSSSVLGDRLKDEDREMYDALLKKVKDTAAGKISKTVFDVDFYLKVSIPSVHNDLDEFNKVVAEHVEMVFYALLGDCPSELYWFDKTLGIDWRYNYSYNSSYIWITELRMCFYVSADYAESDREGTFYMNAARAYAIQIAAANAQDIMEYNRGKSDAEKLRAYKNEICALTDYNYSAASGQAYGDPWQLVWVFDGDPDTKVVCEGYSKAFQYLWEISSFGGKITSMLMTGTMLTGSGEGGRHMWNVVTMSDGKKYMVDVTNSDIGSTGSDHLFLTGYDYTTTISGSKAFCYGGLYYVFDQNVPNLYRNEDRDLSGTDYDPEDDDIIAYGTCGADLEWTLSYDGLLKISGSGAMDDYKSSAYTPWTKWKTSIARIIIGDQVTKIGSSAFAGLKNARSVTIGKAVKKIGAKAFYKSTKLDYFNILTKKLKTSTVGDNAFKSTAKKALFLCPEGKVSSYKKLLIKKGASKKATFR